MKIMKINHCGPRPGLILPFTLFILTLLSLMGVILMTSSRQEVGQASQTRLAQDTFNAAESSAMVATLLSRILLRPELGSPQQALRKSAGKFPLDLAINEKRFNLATLVNESAKSDYSFMDRYAETGWGGPASMEPHLAFSINGEKVAWAVVQIDGQDLAPSGASLGMNDRYDSSAATAQLVNIIVSVRGLNGRANPGATTFITSMYREAL
ncbi:MAG: hypothetical protein LBE80_01870 [Deltaproteobacteria bacterium]|jgi:hypothetical protein|nr:hypothetical protein [Deltaproteobacteria bacterium]